MRVRRRDAEHGGRASGPAPELSSVLALQRMAGNRAVSQLVSRKPATKRRSAPRQTGLRSSEAIKRYAKKAVSFFRRNPDLPLRNFAIYLGAAVNTELETLGVKVVRVKVDTGALAAAAEFDASSWTMFLNPAEFTHREEVRTLGDLTPDEAAKIAMTVFHEARHAEQHFRIARLLSSEHKALDFEMDADAAEAAGDAPLRGRALAEARDWHTNVAADDATYREAVTTWIAEVRKAAMLARDVDAKSAAEVRERLGRLIHGWSKPGGAEDYIRSHLGSARKRRASLIVDDITRIVAAFDRVEAAFKALPEDAEPPAFKKLAAELIELNKAVYAAYTDQPVEADAWEAGNAIYEAFNKAFAAASVP
jgi:hypothetical protein